MSDSIPAAETVESRERVELWREYLRSRLEPDSAESLALEGRVRTDVATLTASGLTSEEAFLVAMRRMGEEDGWAGELAVESGAEPRRGAWWNGRWSSPSRWPSSRP